MVAYYLLLQIPGWVLAAAVLLWVHARFAVPDWMLWAIAVAFVAKDAALFPLTWRAYAGPDGDGMLDPVGRLGVCTTRLAPRGNIRVVGETWQAVCESDCAPMAPGSTVRVTSRNGLILRVRADGDGHQVTS